MEHEIEIEFIYRKRKLLNFWKGDLIQTKPFEIGFLLRNRGNTPLLGATLSGIRWSSAAGQQMFSSIDKSFHIDSLNPGEERKIWIEKAGTYVYGLCHIDLNISSDTVGQTIKTYQVNPFTKEVTFFGTNVWSDFFFIRNINEYQQGITNSFLFYFSVITVVLSIQTWKLTQLQTYYSEVQSRAERIHQAQAESNAIELCKQNPDLNDSGLSNLQSGASVSCAQVREVYKDRF